MIYTTLNIHKGVFEKISAAAEKLNKSKREIIVLLLMKLMGDYNSFRFRFSAVAYQPDADEDSWHCFHINFREHEYEYFTDLRKLTKFSVSFLLRIAVYRYLDKLTESFDEPTDNYLMFKDYTVLHKDIDGFLVWTFIWGAPAYYLNTLDLT